MKTLMLSFNLSLAFTSVLSEIGQIKNTVVISSGVNTLSLSPCKVRMALPLYRIEQVERDRRLHTVESHCVVYWEFDQHL